MKITYIVGQFPKLSNTFILSQITGLIDRGHDVEILSVNPPTEQTVHEDVTKYALLEKTHYINKSPSSLGFELNEHILPLLMFTDLIHAHFLARPADWAQTISKMFNIPFIVTGHAFDIFIEPDADELKRKFERSTKVITISDYNQNYLLDLLGKQFRDKIEVIRCGIDLEQFNYIKRNPGRVTKILLVGRLVEKKGTLFAIEAFEKLNKQYHNTELRIVGEGPLKDELMTKIAELGLGNKIILLGDKSTSSVLEELNKADIFLHPSVTANNGDREGIPVSIMEAQATGLPVVSTVHTGIPELVIDGKTGFLVPEKDTDALADKLGKLVSNLNLRLDMGKAGRSFVEENYNGQREIDQLEELFKSVITYNKLISEMSQKQLNSIKQRAKLVGDLLSKLDSEIRESKELIKQKNTEIKRKNSQIKRKTNQLEFKNIEINKNNEKIHELQTHLDYIHSTSAYKIYKGFNQLLLRIKRLIKPKSPE